MRKVILCLLVSLSLWSCRKEYDKVEVPYNDPAFSEYDYTTKTDYYEKNGLLSETRQGVGSLYINVSSSSYMYIDMLPLVGWQYTLNLNVWDQSNGLFNIATQDVYVNSDSFRITQRKQGVINADGSLDFYYESYDYDSGRKTVNSVHAVKK